VQFDVLTEDLTTTLAQLTLFLNLGSGEKPKAGLRSRYFAAWVTANGEPPHRQSKLSCNVFVRRHAHVQVGDTERDFEQKKVKTSFAYSVIRRVVSWDTGRGS
jgi:hypothetical protein